MKLLLFATLLEAQESLLQLKAKKHSEHLYTAHDLNIVISGIGIVNAYATLKRWAPLASEIWNVGFAGSLHSSHPVGTLHFVREVRRSSLPPLTLPSEGLCLLTVDTPLHSEVERERLSFHHDLVDMEGYAVVRVAQDFQKPLHLLKIISDIVSEKGRSSIRHEGKNLSKILASNLSVLWDGSEDSSQRNERPNRLNSDESAGVQTL